MPAFVKKNVAVAAVAHGSAQGFLLQQVCRRRSPDCQTSKITQRLAAGVPSRAQETCRQVMSAEE